jgi:hypothetical protein
MSRVRTFIGIGLAIMMAVFARRLAFELLAPGAPLYLLIEHVTWPVDGDQWAREAYVTVSVWVPWLLVGGSLIIGAYREVTRQNVTQVRARR